MKRGWIGLVLVMMGMALRAQTFDEWWEQNKTRKKYNEQQITAWQVYIGYAQKGFKIVESGLATIRDLKTGEFHLHTDFYDGLSAINPAVGNMAEVVEMIVLQAAIVERFKSALARYRQNTGLRSDEVEYIGRVYADLLAAGLADINNLMDIITADRLKMSDDQRMERIGDLDRAMKERYAFTKAFTDQSDLLSMQQQRASGDVGTLKGLYGIP